MFGDLSDLPPCLVQVSRQELLLDDGIRLAERLARSGTQAKISKWSQMPHVWQLLHRYLPQADEALRELGDFLQQHVSGEPV